MDTLYLYSQLEHVRRLAYTYNMWNNLPPSKAKQNKTKHLICKQTVNSFAQGQLLIDV